MKREDLSGQVFGRLTVLHEAARHANGRLQWACECVCGKRLIVMGYYLRMKQTRSCGCLKIDRMSKPLGVANSNRIRRTYKQNARKRGLVWAISDKRFESLISGNCFYCGAAPSMIAGEVAHPIPYSGIDRCDNTQGYLDDNVVSCCRQCNWAKSNLSVVEFELWIRNVARHFLGLHNDF